MSTKQQGALAQFGVPLSENGFEVIWIPPGRKGPAEDKWQSIATNPEIIRKHASNGKANFNVGIRTAYTPAVDLDILDKDFADELEAWCLETLGPAPVRVGRAPKRLLVYSTTTPMRKRQLEYFDLNGERNKIEVLGQGQQFVAYGIHPDTKKPYVWTSETQLVDLDAFMDLTVLDADKLDMLFSIFAKGAEARGWKRGTGSEKAAAPSSLLGPAGEADIDVVQTRGQFTREEIDAYLKHLSPDDGYDRWLQVGQAIHNYFDGDEEGQEIWDEWSMASADYDSDEIERKWESFGQQTGGVQITMRSLAAWSKDKRVAEQKVSYEDLIARIDAVDDPLAFDEKFMRAIAEVITEQAMLDALLDRMKRKVKELGSSVRIDTLRKTMKTAQRRVSRGTKAMPPWCQDYVFVCFDNKFINVETMLPIDDRGFNAKFNRHVVGGEDAPNAARYALDELQMPVLDKYTYLPGHAQVVEEDSIKFLNIYSDKGVPAIPKKVEGATRDALKLVQDHFKLMFPNDKERKLLISYFAYIVQNLDKRVRWCPLVYGGEGAGKTFFSVMMRNVLGMSNVMPVNARQLHQQFTSWAEGKKMIIFEEIRLKGQNRHEVIEAVKPYITNDTVDIRRMQTDVYAIPNVTCYLLFTNHLDALPLAIGDRRFFVLATSLLTGPQIMEFNRQNPDYFLKLFDALRDHPGAILKWLQNYELHPEFHANGHAPETDVKKLMREASQHEGFDDVEGLIEREPRWDVSSELLCIKSLRDYCGSLNFDGGEADIDESSSITLPPDTHMKPLLEQLGFQYLGRARPTAAGGKGKGSNQQRYWSRYPEKFLGHDLQKRVREIRESFNRKNQDELGLD